MTRSRPRSIKPSWPISSSRAGRMVARQAGRTRVRDIARLLASCADGHRGWRRSTPIAMCRWTWGVSRRHWCPRDLRLHAERGRYLMVNDDWASVLMRAAETGGVVVSEVLANRLGLERAEQ